MNKVLLFLLYGFCLSAFAQYDTLQSAVPAMINDTEIAAPSNRTGFLTNTHAENPNKISWTQYWVVPAIDINFQNRFLLHFNNMLMSGVISTELVYSVPLNVRNSSLGVGLFVGKSLIFESPLGFDFGPTFRWTFGSEWSNVTLAAIQPYNVNFYRIPILNLGCQLKGAENLGVVMELSNTYVRDSGAGQDTGDGAASLSNFAFGFKIFKPKVFWTLGVMAVTFEKFNDAMTQPIFSPFLIVELRSLR